MTIFQLQPTFCTFDHSAHYYNRIIITFFKIALYAMTAHHALIKTLLQIRSGEEHGSKDVGYESFDIDLSGCVPLFGGVYRFRRARIRQATDWRIVLANG